MTKLSKRLIITLSFFLLSLQCFSQKKDSTLVGKLEGILKDTVHNYVLQSATISIYKPDNAKLLAYGLTDKMGQFVVKDLPVGTQLKLVASHVGYTSYQRNFFIPIEKKALDLKTVNMGSKAENTLDEVMITAKPPVTVNGDTLEFHADAFDLDTNATLEDLMRKLTGVTIWSDGLITVNGVKVNNLYVEGKQFFGGDAKIAMQNLPKNIVDKVQVYKEEKPESGEDPNLNVNVVLKKDKKSGLFGKVGGGFGTDKRFAFDGMLSAYTPKTEVSVVGAHNNVNKVAGTVNTLMQYSSFKGEGVDNDYHSDFRQPGLNIFSSGGAHIAHEFRKNNSLNIDYFFDHSKNTVLRDEFTVENLNNGSQLFRNSQATSINNGYNHKVDANYNLDLAHQVISTGYFMRSANSNGSNHRLVETQNTGTDVTSTGVTMDKYDRNSTEMGANFKLVNKSYVNANKNRSFDFELEYRVASNERNIHRQNRTELSSSNVSSNQFFDRSYDTDFGSTSHQLNFRLPAVNARAKILRRLMTVDFRNNLITSNEREKALVSDLLQNGEYQPNRYLTNNSKYETITERPELSIYKTFHNVLVNRYQKSLSIQFLAQAEVFNQRNSSDKAFQKIQRTHTNFVPEATISYTNKQVGRYESTFRLSYIKSINYPNIYQLAPLVDSANVYVLHFGNLGLQPVKKHEFLIGVKHLIKQTKNPGNGSFAIKGGFNQQFISDSVIYDALGRRILYNVNVSGNKYIGYSGFLRKIYKIKESLVELLASSDLNYSHNPSYVNNDPILFKALYLRNSLKIDYSYKNWLKLGGGQAITTSSTRQTNSLNTDYNNYSTSAHGSINWPKKVYWSSNINFNRSVASYSRPINYTIWNANVVYRILKGNNAEVKFSALDLLHQNTSILNTGTGNSITRGTVNVLQQYFMVSFAYYPRVFGDTSKKR